MGAIASTDSFVALEDATVDDVTSFLSGLGGGRYSEYAPVVYKLGIDGSILSEAANSSDIMIVLANLFKLCNITNELHQLKLLTQLKYMASKSSLSSFRKESEQPRVTSSSPLQFHVKTATAMSVAMGAPALRRAPSEVSTLLMECGICLETMETPVTLSCGHNACKSCLLEAFTSISIENKDSCPFCRAKVDTDFRTNMNVNVILDKYILKAFPELAIKREEEQARRKILRKIVEQMRFDVTVDTFESDTAQTRYLAQEEAAAAIWMQVKDSGDPVHIDNRKTIVDAGCIPILIDLCRRSDESDNNKVQEYATGIIRKLTFHDENSNLIVSAGGIPVLVDILKCGHSAVQEQAAVAIGNLSNDENLSVLVAEVGAIPLLIELCKSNHSVPTQEAAAGSLWNISYSDKNCPFIVDNGGILVLVELCKTGSDEAKENAVNALANMSYDFETMKLIVDTNGSIPALVDIAKNGRNAEAKEAAVCALGNISQNAGGLVSVTRFKSFAEFKMDSLDDDAHFINRNRQIVAAAGITALVETCKSGTDDAKQMAAAALVNISSASDENRKLIVATGHIL